MDVASMWWCSTCSARIPQPRWMHMRSPQQFAYHVEAGNRMHRIERVPVLDGELVEA